MILFAPDSYGGFLTAPEAVVLAEESRDDLRGHAMADGGEGSLAVLQAHTAVTLTRHPVRGPYGEPLQAALGHTDSGCVLESAEACGLRHTKRRAPLQAGTLGVGQLLAACRAPTTIGLGGSATVDGGVGLLQGLGLTPVVSGQPLLRPLVAGDLISLTAITGLLPDLPPLTVLLDVTTPLTDAARVFGPQKGLAADEIAPMAAAHARLVGVLNDWRAQHGLPALPPDLSGGGAAGGLGFALAALGATLRPGAEHFAALTRLPAAIEAADCVVLGEGRLDPTSYQGKVAGVVSRLARQAGKPVWAVVGTARDVPPPPMGPDRIIEIGGMDRDAFCAAIRRL